MGKIEWTEDLQVNILSIDNEHKKLVDFLNRMDEAMSKGQSKNILGEILDGLINYANIHFTNEEKLMAEHNYPGLTDHKKLHLDFVQKMKTTQADFNSGQISLGIQVYNHLLNWLKNHIQIIDRKYAEHILKTR